MKRCDGDCNIDVTFRVSIVADKVNLDGAAGKHAGEYVTFEQLSLMKQCSYEEAHAVTASALAPLDDYTEAFVMKLKELFNNDLKALIVHADFNPVAKTFIDYEGDVLVITDFAITAYIKDLDDSCDPYEYTCYLIEKAMDYARNENRIKLYYDVEID